MKRNSFPLFKVGLLSLMILSLCPHAGASENAQDILYSPASLMNPYESISEMNAFGQDPDAKALSDFLLIYYDYVIHRPWGDAYWPEANQRWQILRSALCPELSSLCKLPAVISNPTQLGTVMLGLSQEPIWSGLVHHFSQRSPRHPFFLEGIRLPNDPAATGVSFLMSGSEKSFEEGHVSLWGMSEDHLIRKEMEYIQVSDMDSYFSGFSNVAYPDYLSLEVSHPNQVIQNIDAIKLQAEHFAADWKLDADHPPAGEALQEPMLYFEKFIDGELYRKYQPDFAKHYADLIQRLQKLPSDVVAPVLKRFQEERAKGRYPEEVFQYVAYDLYQPLLRIEGDYYSLAARQRVGLDSERLAWESLLALQAGTDPRLLLFFANEEAMLPGRTILQQFDNPSILIKYFNEEIEAILALGPYQGHDIFSRFEYALRGPDVFDADYLKRENPDLLKKLTDPATGKLRDVYAMNDSEQKEVFKDYYSKKDGKVIESGLLRLMLTATLNMTDSDAQWLARHIHQVRESEFHKPAAP